MYLPFRRKKIKHKPSKSLNMSNVYVYEMFLDMFMLFIIQSFC